MTTHTEDVRRLESDFAAAMTQMYAVGNNLARLRAQLELEGRPEPGTTPQVTSAAAALAPSPTAPVVTSTTPAPPPAPAPARAFPSMAPPQGPAPRPAWWQRVSLVSLVIGGAGALITLLGVVFLIRLAIAVGIFGPLPRVLAGAVVALALAGAAALVRRRNHVGSLAVAGTAVAAAYLDIMGATLTYHFVPDVIGLAAASVATAAGLSVARWWRSQFLGCAAVLGVALLGPALAHGPGLATSAFLVVLTVASWPAQIGRRWHVLEAVRVLPTAAFVTASALDAGTSYARLGHVALALVLAVTVVGTSVAALRSTVLPRQLGVLAPVAWLPLLVAAAVVPGHLGLTLVLGVTALAAGAYAATGTEAGVEVIHRARPLLAGAVLLGLHVAALHDGPARWMPSRLVLAALVLTTVAVVVRHRWLSAAAGVAATTAAMSAAPYAGQLLFRSSAERLGVAGPLALALVALTMVLATRLRDGRRPERPWAVAAGLLALVWGLATVTATVAAVGARFDVARSAFVAGHALASVLLLAAAVALLLSRRILHGTLRVHVSIGLAALAVLKLLLFDANALDGFFLMLGFLAAGPILLTMGVVYAKALAAARRDEADDPRDGAIPARAVENRPVPAPAVPSVDATGPIPGPTQ